MVIFTMAEDEDGVSNRKSPQNPDENAGPSQDNEQNTAKPDLGIEEAKYNSNENGASSPTEPRSSTSKSTGATRKDENPFSFRHFLKRDLSLPGNSTYENTGARPKVYASTVQHSPTKLDLHSESRRNRDRAECSRDSNTKNTSDNASNRISEIPSISSIEIPLCSVDSSDSKQNVYVDSSDQLYHRPNLASEPLGMPSLPDFVQDHILVEQAYLSSNGPISVDLDNLPDFTFNTNYNASASSSFPTGRQNNSEYRSRTYYHPYTGVAPVLADSFRDVPLDLPAGAEAAGPGVEHPHLSLDLTESVNPADRRNTSPRNNFDNPLDLPPNAGTESMRLPDFLPLRAGAGRNSPEPDPAVHPHHVAHELDQLRAELFTERARRCRVEEELQSQRESASLLRAEAAAARASEAALRARLDRASDREVAGRVDTEDRAEGTLDEAACTAKDSGDTTVAKLKKEIKRLKEELRASRAETTALRRLNSGAASDLRRAASHADVSLRDLLAGLDQLRALATRLDGGSGS